MLSTMHYSDNCAPYLIYNNSVDTVDLPLFCILV